MSSEISAEQLAVYSFYLGEDEFPHGWTITTLQHVSHVITDGTHKTPKYVPSGVRFISIKNIKPFQPVNWDSYEKYITREEHEELIRRCRPERDDILFPRIGTLGYAKRIDFEKEVSLFVGLGLIKPIRECVLPKYMEYYLNTPYISTLSKDKANGSGRMTLPLEESRKFPIPLPPLNEQCRIVAKIEELFSELDKGVESLSTAREQLKAYRQSVLKSAFEGKLTESWRAKNADKLESPETLVARIKEEREDCYKAALDEWEAALAKWRAAGEKYRKPVKPQKPNWPEARDFDSLAELPHGWFYLPFEAVAWSIRNGISAKPDESGPLKIFRISAVRPMMFNLTDFRYITDPDGSMEEYRLNHGDLVFTRYNGSRDYVGVSAVYRGDGSHVYPDKLIRCEIKSEILNPAFLEGATNSGESRAFLEQRIRTTAGQSGVSGGDIKAMPVVVCSSAEQAEIVRIVESKLQAAHIMEAEIEAGLARAEALRQSILRRAFSGQLVAQDPADEPASVLLERIRAERDSSGETKRRNNKNGKKEAA